MPVTKGAQKALRSSACKRAVNLVTIKKYKDAVRAVRKASKKDEAVKLLAAAFKQLDKAAKKHVIHKNKAARLKSRLSKSVSKTG